MSEAFRILVIVYVFRLSCVAAGCFLATLGYKLFALGVYQKDGELAARYKGASLTLRQVGPGVFFAFFGILLASVGFLRPFDLKTIEPLAAATRSTTPSVDEKSATTPTIEYRQMLKSDDPPCPDRTIHVQSKPSSP